MISAFEYVTVLISIVLGLGITQVLTGIADLVHQSNRVKVYWPHFVWVFLVLLMHVQEWWVTYDLKNYEPWRLPTFFFIMLYPVNLFILARLLFPFGMQDGIIDLKTFYFENYRKIFGFTCALILLAILDGVFIRSRSILDESLKLVLLLLMLFFISRKSLAELAHKIIATVFLFLLLLSIAVEWNVWLIGN